MSEPKSLRASIAARIPCHSTLVSVTVLSAIVAATLPKMYPRETFDALVDSVSALRAPQAASSPQLLRVESMQLSTGAMDVEPIEDEKAELAVGRFHSQSMEG